MNMIFRAFVLLCFFVSTNVFAVCSIFESYVTINEIYKESGNNKPAFVEIKVSDSFIGDSNDINDWIIRICHDSSDCKDIDVENLTVQDTYYYSQSDIDEFDIADYLDVHQGFDVSILDVDNNFIDYIRIDSSGEYLTGQWTDFNAQCGYSSLSYVEDIPDTITNGSVILFRSPDGTGTWIEDKNLSTYPITPGENNQGTPAELLVHYEFNEGVEQTIADSSGNGYSATLGTSSSVESNDPLWQCNSTGYQLDFDAAEGQKVYSPSFTPPPEGTIAFWMKVPSISGSRQRIFGFSDNFEARWEGTGKIHWDINYQGFNNSGDLIGSQITAIDTWIHFAFITSVENGTWSLYENGILVNSGTKTLSAQSASVLTLGARTNRNSEFFTGSLDDFRIYSGHLTENEITTLAANPPLDNCVGCEAYFPDSFQGHNSSSLLKFDDSGGDNYVRIQNDIDNILTFPSQIDESSGGQNTCDTEKCSVTSTYASVMSVPDFVIQAASEDIALSDNSLGSDKTIGDGGDFPDTTINELDISNYAIVTLLSSSNDFYIDHATFNNANVTFNEGIYYFNELEILANTDITVNGAVTIYINSQIDIDDNSTININGDAKNLVIITHNTLNMNANAVVHAVLYSKGNIIINDNAKHTGVSSTFGELNLKNNARLTYENISGLKIGGICGDDDDEPIIHHYQIIHSDSGLTCDSENVTIKACTNSDYSSCTESSTPVSLDLLIDGSSNVTKAANFTGNTNPDISFNYTQAEPVTLSIANASVVATNDIFCSDNSYNDSNCEMTFLDTGFRFLSDGAEVISIPPQLSGKDSDEGYNATTLAIQSIQKNPNSGACEGVVINQEIEFSAQCTNPNSCSEVLFVNGNDVPTTAGSPVTYKAIDIGFNGTDTADFILNYPDAGALSLYARYNIPVDGSPSGTYMTGESSFTVRPFGFEVLVAGNPAAENADGDVFIAAGEDFSVTLSAKQWQQADDVDDNGIPDDGADLSNNITTENFSGYGAEITHSLFLPSSGINPSLSGNVFSSFIDGSDSQDISWNEVGILSFDVGLSGDTPDYLGAGNIQGNAPFVGRFTPHHYKQTVSEPGELMGECSDGSWVYSGQMEQLAPTAGAIRYKTQPILDITAYAKIDDVGNEYITENFTIGGDTEATEAENFNKLARENVSFFNGDNNDGVLTDNNQTGKNTAELLTLSANWSLGEMIEHPAENGTVQYTLSDSDHYFYVRSLVSEVSPFIAEIPLALTSIVDVDGVSNLVETVEVDGEDVIIPVDFETAFPIGVEVRFGRLFMPNTYGPETSPVPIPMQIEYLSSNGQYIVNTDDSCTNISTENNELSFSNDADNVDPTLSLDAVATQLAVAGGVDFIQIESQTNNQGTLNVEFDVISWLKFDWDGDGSHDDNPDTIATFGLFRGNDRIIQWREINPN